MVELFAYFGHDSLVPGSFCGWPEAEDGGGDRHGEDAEGGVRRVEDRVSHLGEWDSATTRVREASAVV
jgi:hypothetical protein